MQIISATILLAMLGTIAGCQSGPQPEPKFAPASRSVPEVEKAADELARARCERAQRCNEVGPTSKYETLQDCQQTMLVDTQEELGDCHQGVDRGDFNQCLATVREQDCRGAMDSLRESKACSSDDLCAD